MLANDRLAHRAGGRSIVLLHRYIVSACRSVKLDPVGGRRATDENELVLVQVKQNPITDHVAIVVTRDELLGSVDRELRKAIDGKAGEQFERVRSLDEQIHHVVGLVEQHAGLPPGFLFVAPIGEFRRDDGIDVGADLRIVQHRHWIAGSLQRFFQVFVGHVIPNPPPPFAPLNCGVCSDCATRCDPVRLTPGRAGHDGSTGHLGPFESQSCPADGRRRIGSLLRPKASIEAPS